MKKLIIFPLVLITFCVLAQNPTSRIDKALSIYNDVWRQLDICYADTLNYEQLVESSINQMLRKIDPYTVYMPEDKTRDLKFMTTGKYGGIGALIMQREDTTVKGKKQTYVAISEPYEDKPAWRNDVRAGDKILMVDGVDVAGKTTAEVSKLLRGVPHSVVKLKLEREGEKKPIIKEFEREEIKINPVDYATVTDGIGYILFADFTEGSSDIFRDSIDNMVKRSGISKLIIDLRGNGGGIIDEAIKIVGMFVEKGTEVVSTKGKNPSSVRTYRTPTEPRYPDMKIGRAHV